MANSKQKVRFKIGRLYLNVEAIIAILILAVPFLNVWDYFGYPSKLYYCYVLVLILAVAIAYAVIDSIPIQKYALPLMGFLLLSMIIKNFPSSIQYFMVMLCGMLVLHLRYTNKTQGLIVRVICIVGVFYAATLLWHVASPETFYSALRIFVREGNYLQAVYSPTSGNYTGFACESNRAGLCITPAASIFFAKAVFPTHEEKRYKNIALFVFTYICITMTGRRAFILFFPSVVVIVGVYVLMKKRSTIAKLMGITAALIATVLVVFYFYDKIINLLTDGSSTGIALSNREIYWGLALKMFSSSPIIGNGMRSYDYYYNNMTGRNIIFAGAHNCYLQMLAEIGIVGTALFIFFIIVVLVKTIRCMVFCIKERQYRDATVSISSVMMQMVFILLAMSESSFIAPYSLILYFILVNLGMNTIVNVNYALQKESQ